MEKIEFTFSDTSETVEFFVLEQTRVNGNEYLLVTDSDEEEANGYIMKEVAVDGKDEITYEMVEDDTEADAVWAVFSEILDEIEMETE